MVWDCPNCGIKFNCNGIIYILKKKKKNNLNKMGIRRSLYKNEIIGYTNKCFLRNGNNYYHLLNSDFRDDNYNKQLKRTGSSNSTIRKK